MTPFELLSVDPRRSRFLAGVGKADDGGCWPWQRALNSSGYGVLRVGHAGEKWTVMAHRAAWMLANGREVGDDMQVDHVCGSRSCCNPAHLREVTRSVNVRASSRHVAGDAPVRREGPRTIRQRGDRFMVIWREYLTDGAIRQVGLTFPTRDEALTCQRDSPN